MAWRLSQRPRPCEHLRGWESSAHRTSHVLITEIKLGEYNGLQLALRGQAAGVPTIVLGPESFEHEEVEQPGATFLSSDDLRSDELECAIENVVDLTGSEAAWSSWDATTASAQVLH